MYAVVDIAGQQFKVSKNDKILAPKIDGKEGDKVQLDKVLLISDKGNVTVGQPIIDGACVDAKILGFERGDKVIVFKKKRRKGYKVKKGHRQDYTALMIENIVVKKQAKPGTPKETQKTAPKTTKSSKSKSKQVEAENKEIKENKDKKEVE